MPQNLPIARSSASGSRRVCPPPRRQHHRSQASTPRVHAHLGNVRICPWQLISKLQAAINAVEAVFAQSHAPHSRPSAPHAPRAEPLPQDLPRKRRSLLPAAHSLVAGCSQCHRSRRCTNTHPACMCPARCSCSNTHRRWHTRATMTCLGEPEHGGAGSGFRFRVAHDSGNVRLGPRQSLPD